MIGPRPSRALALLAVADGRVSAVGPDDEILALVGPGTERVDLDRAASDHPVVVVRGGHEYVLNSAALRRFGIDRDTPEPQGGRIGRYGDGRLNGELVDRAKRLARLPFPPELDREQHVNPLSTEPEALRDATVWLTMVGGEIVWRREEG